MNIIEKGINEIIPYEKNPRRNDKAVKYVANSIKEFGFKIPIVIDKDNVIVCGHTRLKAAKRLRMKTVPCIIADDLNEDQIKAFRLADNKVSEIADWDMNLLGEEIGELVNWDLSDFGFDFNETKDGAAKETVEDDFDVEKALKKEPKSKIGDIYQLGKHRLMCGDSTKQEDVERLMNGEKADMVFTDPPYNMSDHLTGFVSDETKEKLSRICNFDPKTIINSLFAINTKNYFVFTSKDLILQYFDIFKEWSFNILVWCKDNPTPMTNNTFLPDVEYLLYFYKKERVWNNGLDISVYKKYYNSNKMEGRKEAGNVHPTIKPIKIIADKIQVCSMQDGIIVDLFGGSGSTLIACEQTNRKCFMMEIDPKYIDVIIDRWEAFTGEKAIKIS